MVTPSSLATMPASVVLPRPGGPAKQQVVDRLAAPAGRLQHHVEVVLQLGLAHEVGQPPRAEAGLDVGIAGPGLGHEQLVAHDSDLPAHPPQRSPQQHRSSAPASDSSWSSAASARRVSSAP